MAHATEVHTKINAIAMIRLVISLLLSKGVYQSLPPGLARCFAKIVRSGPQFAVVVIHRKDAGNLHSSPYWDRRRLACTKRRYLATGSQFDVLFALRAHCGRAANPAPMMIAS